MDVSMSFKRQMKRRAEKKARKDAEKKTKKALNELASIPQACSMCDAPFDPKDDFCLDNWTVKVTQSSISMYCDRCKAKA